MPFAVARRAGRLTLVPLASAVLLSCAAQRLQEQVAGIRPPAVPLPAESASASATRFSFIAYGDTRGRRDGVATQEEHELVVETMLGRIAALKDGPDPVRFVIQSGDAVVDGRDPKQWNVSFVGLINRITQGAGLPYYLAPGNHDVTAAEGLRDPGRREGLANYLQAVAPLIPANGSMRRLDGYPTFAFGYGNTFVLAFDSNIADDATQFAWVRGQLEGLDRARYQHVVVMFHHPVLSSGPHGGATIEPPTEAVRRRYLPLFRQHHVRLMVTGHEHLYEHWAEQYRDAAGSWRMDQIVSGGGGAPIYHFEGDPDQRAYLRSSRAAAGTTLTQLVKPGPTVADNPYHFCIVHVDGARMWVEVVGVDFGSGFKPYQSGRVELTDSLVRR